jgi:riboflavin synthase
VVQGGGDSLNLSLLQPEDWVNLEGDILGKYVERFLRSGNAADYPTWGTLAPEPRPARTGPDSVSAAFLADNGYL